MSHFCMVDACNQGKREADGKLKTGPRRPEALRVVLAQTCVSRPIRADWVFRKGALKRQELKQRGNTELLFESCVF